MITIKNGVVLQGSDLVPIKTNLSIQDQKIIEISPHASGGKQIDAKGCIISPGLINSHIHLGDSIAKDVGDGKPLEDVVKPPYGLKHKILQESDHDNLVEGIRESIKQMITSGTTSFIDFREGGVEGVEILREAQEDFPIRGICLGRQDSFLDKDIKLKILEKDLYEILKISEGIGISGFGEISDQNAEYIVSKCKKLGKTAAIHVAENAEVQETSLKTKGQTEIERAIQAGFHLLIHVTSPVEDDIELLSKSDISVVTCPRANGMLSTGIPPLLEMHKSGINLLLGTDNVMFNQPDMFREMEYALKVTRGLYTDYFPPKEIFKMATSNAGQFINNKLGILDEGYLADLIVVEQQSVDPILSLINRSQSKNIKTVMTDGTIIYQR